jgi:hypothetical protein
VRDADVRPRPATSDVAGTLILAVVGGVALVMGMGYGFLEEGRVGPGFLPVVTAGFILVAALAELARLYLKRPRQHAGSLMGAAEAAENQAAAAIERTERPEERDTFGRTATERRKAILQVFAVMFLALLIIPVVGLLLSLTAMVLAIMLWIERKSPRTAIAVTAGALALVYVVFVQILEVPVPQGLLSLI